MSFITSKNDFQKSPHLRPSSQQLLSHIFVTRHRSPNVLIDLIQRTKAAVRDLDNLNYRKMKKILMVDNCETESNIDSLPDVDDAPEEPTGGDSSKSNSVTSEHSVHSVGVSASSQSSSTNSLPAGEWRGGNYAFELFFYLVKYF